MIKKKMLRTPGMRLFPYLLPGSKLSRIMTLSRRPTEIHVKSKSNQPPKKDPTSGDDFYHSAWAPPPGSDRQCCYSQPWCHNISHIPRGRRRQLFLGRDKELCQQPDSRERFSRFTFLKQDFKQDIPAQGSTKSEVPGWALWLPCPCPAVSDHP